MFLAVQDLLCTFSHSCKCQEQNACRGKKKKKRRYTQVSSGFHDVEVMTSSSNKILGMLSSRKEMLQHNAEHLPIEIRSSLYSPLLCICVFMLFSSGSLRRGRGRAKPEQWTLHISYKVCFKSEATIHMLYSGGILLNKLPFWECSLGHHWQWEFQNHHDRYLLSRTMFVEVVECLFLFFWWNNFCQELSL